MTKDEAQEKIDVLLKETNDKVLEAQKVADEHGLEFEYVPDQIGTYYGKGSEGRWGDEGDQIGEGEWYPSAWNSSSLYC